MAYQLNFDVVGYKTGPERADTRYVSKAESAEHDFDDAAEGEVERLTELGAISEEGGEGSAGLEGDEVFLNPELDPAGQPVDQPRTDAEWVAEESSEAAATDVGSLRGQALDDALAEAGIDGSGMRVAEKREALRSYQAGEAT
jgi:hypothetical protein